MHEGTLPLPFMYLVGIFSVQFCPRPRCFAFTLCFISFASWFRCTGPRSSASSAGEPLLLPLPRLGGKRVAIAYRSLRDRTCASCSPEYDILCRRISHLVSVLKEEGSAENNRDVYVVRGRVFAVRSHDRSTFCALECLLPHLLVWFLERSE